MEKSMVQDIVASRTGRGYAVLAIRLSKVGTRSIQRTEQHGIAVFGEMGIKKVGMEEVPTTRILIH